MSSPVSSRYQVWFFKFLRDWIGLDGREREDCGVRMLGWMRREREREREREKERERCLGYEKKISVVILFIYGSKPLRGGLKIVPSFFLPCPEVSEDKVLELVTDEVRKRMIGRLCG